MSDAVLVALITGGLMLAGNIIIAVITNSKTIYRIEQLEKKQDHYNQLSDRVIQVEKDVKHIFYEIDEMKGKK